MKKIAVLLALSAGSIGPALAADLEALTANSREAIQIYGTTLKQELQTAMKAGGPMNAVEVCNLSAPAIAAKVSASQDVAIGRTSLKNRNADNAPTDWQRTVLESFEARKAAGEDAAALEYAEIVDTEAGPEFRFMKAIPTGEVCLNCHGSDLSAELSAKIRSHYPDDKATGFAIGDLRGAFVVTESVDP